MKKVFLSFAEQDIKKVKDLLPLLSCPDYELDFYDGSLDVDFDSEEATAIKQAIGERIVKCSITVCLISDNTQKSKWVNLELQKSRNKGNKIIAMALKGITEAVLPAVIKEENIRFGPWDPKKLSKLIQEESPSIFQNSV